MEKFIDKFKGVHPGAILERELKKRKLKKGPFAISLQQYPQVINEITKKRRGLTPSLSLKIDRALGFEDGTMLILQAYYDIQREIDREKSHPLDRPNLNILRHSLFWDTDITQIDWYRQARAIIQRVFERGNLEEKIEITGFYGKDKVTEVIGTRGIREMEDLDNNNTK